MKTILFAFLGGTFLFLFGCSSTPPKTDVVRELPEYHFPVSLEKLKGLAVEHAETRFQADLKERRLNADEITLRDYAYRYQGKTHPPLSYEVSQPWMTEKAFGKNHIEKSIEGPVDIVVDNPRRFILFYRNLAYLGEHLSDKESRLTILDTKPFEQTAEEIEPKDAGFSGKLIFDSLILDLDKTLKEGRRNRIAEWEILTGVDPEQAKEVGGALGVEG